MLLRKMAVKNFGPFEGEHTLDLLGPCRAEGRRPVVLVGGLNGSGKSSLLEAVRLCLHGRRAFGNPRNGDYHKHLRNRIHRSNEGARSATSSVRLEIETVEVGHRHIYEIIRSWRDITDAGEELHITRDGEEFREINADQYQEFLDELVPLGLAEFFFFDGEKIQKLAEEDGNDRVVADSIRSLLGLHVTSRLIADMSIYMRSRDRGKPLGDVLSEVNAAEANLADTRARIDDLEGESCALKHRRSQLERAVRLQEEKIASEGGDFARKRETLLEEQSKWQTTLQSTEGELRDLANDLLPFALVPELCEGVRQRVEDEAIARREDYASTFLLSKREELLSLSDTPGFWTGLVGDDLSQQEKALVTKAVVSALNLIAHEQNGEKLSYVHDLSERHQRLLLTDIEQALADLPVRAVRLAKLAEESKENLLRIMQDLQRAPREEVLEPLLMELGQLQADLGEVDRRQAILEEETRRSRNLQQEAHRNLTRLTDHIGSLDDGRRVMGLAAKVQDVLRTYEQELTVARVDHLAESITACYKELVHKESLVSRVGVDPVTLSITLYDARGDVVYRPLLSAGEKQIFAIALLWGLGRASGREIPVIIDTPLARLDAEHRSRLLTRYFPNASHQVILLSTDSEVADAELEVLSPSIAKALHLSFDPALGRSTIEEGYLSAWETNDDH